MQYLIDFTCTMKDKVKFYLYHVGQDVKLIQHISSEYKHIIHKNNCLFLLVLQPKENARISRL
jgi:hypothetical protein